MIEQPPPGPTPATNGWDRAADAGAERDLLPHHRQLIIQSGISPAVAEARGYRTVHTRADLRRIGFSDTQARVPALLIPIHNVRGDISLYQIRPDSPRVIHGKCIKYESPRGARMALDVPPG